MFTKYFYYLFTAINIFDKNPCVLRIEDMLQDKIRLF